MGTGKSIRAGYFFARVCSVGQQFLDIQERPCQADAVVGFGIDAPALGIRADHEGQPQVAHLHLPVQRGHGLGIWQAGKFHLGKGCFYLQHRGMDQGPHFPQAGGCGREVPGNPQPNPAFPEADAPSVRCPALHRSEEDFCPEPYPEVCAGARPADSGGHSSTFGVFDPPGG